MMDASKLLGLLTFRQQLKQYVAAVTMVRWADERKIAMLRAITGTEAINVSSTFSFANSEDKNKFAKVLSKKENSIREAHLRLQDCSKK